MSHCTALPLNERSFHIHVTKILDELFLLMAFSEQGQTPKLLLAVRISFELEVQSLREQTKNRSKVRGPHVCSPSLPDKKDQCGAQSLNKTQKQHNAVIIIGPRCVCIYNYIPQHILSGKYKYMTSNRYQCIGIFGHEHAALMRTLSSLDAHKNHLYSIYKP